MSILAESFVVVVDLLFKRTFVVPLRLSCLPDIPSCGCCQFDMILLCPSGHQGRFFHGHRFCKILGPRLHNVYDSIIDCLCNIMALGSVHVVGFTHS